MRNLALSLGNSFFWNGFRFIGCCIDSHAHCFRHKWLRHVLLMNHGSYYFKKHTILPFGNFILLWCVATREFSLNSVISKKFQKMRQKKTPFFNWIVCTKPSYSSLSTVYSLVSGSAWAFTSWSKSLGIFKYAMWICQWKSWSTYIHPMLRFKQVRICPNGLRESALYLRFSLSKTSAYVAF